MPVLLFAGCPETYVGRRGPPRRHPQGKRRLQSSEMQTLGRLRNLIRAFRLRAIITKILYIIYEEAAILKLRRGYSVFGSPFASAGAAVVSPAPLGAICGASSVETGDPVDSDGGETAAGVLTDSGAG